MYLERQSGEHDDRVLIKSLYFCYSRIANGLHFIDVVPLGEGVENRIHRIQHGDDLHGGNAATDFREGDHVREQY